MVLGLLAGISAPIILKATGLDKKLEKGIKDTGKKLGFKKGGHVGKTRKVLVHKGEYIIPAKDVKKIKKVVKQMKAKPKAKSKK